MSHVHFVHIFRELGDATQQTNSKQKVSVPLKIDQIVRKIYEKDSNLALLKITSIYMMFAVQSRVTNKKSSKLDSPHVC